MTPLDDAYQHALWAKRADICPRHVILAADGPMGQGKATWLEVVRFLAGAAQDVARPTLAPPEPRYLVFTSTLLRSIQTLEEPQHG